MMCSDNRHEITLRIKLVILFCMIIRIIITAYSQNKIVEIELSKKRNYKMQSCIFKLIIRIVIIIYPNQHVHYICTLFAPKEDKIGH